MPPEACPAGAGNAGLCAVFATVGGLRVRYLAAGHRGAPVLALIHPVGYPAEVFVRTLAGLADRFEVIAPDLAGQGFSEAPAEWPVPPQLFMARHVLALLDQLGHKRFSVLGSSLGGLVAALIARLAPEQTENLVLVGTGSVFNDPAIQPRILDAVYANGSRAYADPALASCRERLKRTCFEAPPAEDVLLTQITAYALPGAGEAYRRIIEGAKASAADPEATVYPHLESIVTRTLVLLGREDIRTSHEAHRVGAARMPDARLATIERCGHLPQLERPEIFNALVADFLSGQTVGERPAAADRTDPILPSPAGA